MPNTPDRYSETCPDGVLGIHPFAGLLTPPSEDEIKQAEGIVRPLNRYSLYTLSTVKALRDLIRPFGEIEISAETDQRIKLKFTDASISRVGKPTARDNARLTSTTQHINTSGGVVLDTISSAVTTFGRCLLVLKKNQKVEGASPIVTAAGTRPDDKVRVLLDHDQEPGLKDDDGKLRYDLIPPAATKALAQVMTYGAKKYLPNSWQEVLNAAPRYTAALMRHLEAWRAGEVLDPESGLPHMAHLLANAAFLMTKIEEEIISENCKTVS